MRQIKKLHPLPIVVTGPQVNPSVGEKTRVEPIKLRGLLELQISFSYACIYITAPASGIIGGNPFICLLLQGSGTFFVSAQVQVTFITAFRLRNV